MRKVSMGYKTDSKAYEVMAIEPIYAVLHFLNPYNYCSSTIIEGNNDV